MFKNIIGHENTKKLIRVAIESSKTRNTNMPHMLFSGTAGCGKTTMAVETAKAAGVDIIPASTDDFKDRPTILKILERLSHENYDSVGNRLGRIKPSVLFVDEIHRMPARGQEDMGIAMEKLLLPTGRTNKFYWVPHFTLIGATTDDGRLTKPFREKFTLRFLFETYQKDEITDIIRAHADKSGYAITSKACEEIAARSRGIPRTAKAYFDNIRDLHISKGAEIIDTKTALEAFKLQDVDELGLTRPELLILSRLYEAQSPVGVENLAVIANESVKNVKETIEPFLIQLGFIIRSGRGRLLTDEGQKHVERSLGLGRDKVEISADHIRT